MVTLARPELFERRSDWGAGTRPASSLALAPLDGAAMRDLVTGLVPALPGQAVTTIVERARGIPLYAVEMIRMLVVEGRLEPVDGAWRPVGELKDLAVPETLRSLVAARLDALDPADRALLEDAAVLGGSFTLEALTAVSGQPGDALEPRLRGLVRRELLAVEADPRSPERGQYGFVQALVREVAYGTLARADRRARHLAAARHLESLGSDELAGALASHYVAAYRASTEGPESDALAVQARLTLKGAAQRAQDLGAHDQAVAFVEQALALPMPVAEQAALLDRRVVCERGRAQRPRRAVLPPRPGTPRGRRRPHGRRPGDGLPCHGPAECRPGGRRHSDPRGGAQSPPGASCRRSGGDSPNLPFPRLLPVGHDREMPRDR